MTYHTFRLVVFLCSVAAASGVTAASIGQGRAPTVVETFDYDGVSIDSGMFRAQIEQVKDYYLRIPNDDLLKPYRRRAGTDAPGEDLGGVYESHAPFGQFLSGLARLYAAMNDPACIEKAKALMEGWAACIEEDGYGFHTRDLELAPYHFDKLVGGLADMYIYGKDAEALGYLDRLLGWGLAHLPGIEKNINATGGNWYMLNGEWYTLSENLYRAYKATGDAKYRDLAKRFEYTDFWDVVVEGTGVFDRPGWPGWYHAYSHVNSFNGAGAAYEATGDEHYLEVLRRAYEYIQLEQTYVTGGYGPNETLVPRSQLADSLATTSRHFETQCGSWAAFKLCKYLTRFTGEAQYGDWIEALLFNGIGASIPMDGAGHVFYYSDYHLGGAGKSLLPAAWPCCSGTRIQATADYHDLIYYHDDRTLYVSQFVPSTVVWECGGAAVTATQRTRFPYVPEVDLAVSVSTPVRFAVGVRRPAWLVGDFTAVLNGEAVALETDSRGWARLDRTWQSGDVLRLTLPMGFRLVPVSGTGAFPAAIVYGPVAMAVRYAEGNPSPLFDYDHLSATLKPVPGQPLNFRLADRPNVLVRPFFEFEDGESYFLYLDPARPVVRRTFEGIHFQGEWTDFVQWRTTSAPGSYAEHRFEGTGVRVLGQRYDDAGRFEVSIDGKTMGIIDQYGPVRGEDARWDFTGLEPGPHLIRLVLLREPSSKSKGNYGNVSGFEAID